MMGRIKTALSRLNGQRVRFEEWAWRRTLARSGILVLTLGLASCGKPIEGPGRAKITTMDTGAYKLTFLAGDAVRVEGPGGGQVECLFYNAKGEIWGADSFWFERTPARGSIRFYQDTASAKCVKKGG